MIVYNLTIKVANAIESDWFAWMKEEHAVEVLATGLFADYNIFHLLEQDEAEGTTYIVQFYTDSMDKYEQYIAEYAPAFREISFSKWGDGFIAFRSIFESVK